MRQPTTTLPIRVILADDHELVRSAIKALLRAVPGVDVIAEASDGRELVTLVESLHPDIVMTDVSMPGMDGIAAIAEIKAGHPAVRQLVLSMHDTADVVRRAVDAGACGYLKKNSPRFELEHAIHSVMRNGAYFSPAVTQLLLQPAERSADQELTRRQVQIVTLIAQGMDSNAVALELGLSAKTVHVHRARIMERLGLKHVASLTLYALRKGLVKA